jgi:putative ABC transport system permease protein
MGSLFRIAARNAVRHRRRSLVTFSAVFLSLVVVVALRGFLNGLHAAIWQSVVFGQTSALQIHRKGYLAAGDASVDLDLPADAAFLAKISAIPGVKATAPRIVFGGMVTDGDRTTFALFDAIDPTSEIAVCPQRSEVIAAGRALSSAGSAAAVFTPELALSTHARTGQTRALLASDRDGVLNGLDVILAGTYTEPGLPLPGRKVGFVPLEFARELLRMPGRATEIAIAVTDPEDAARMKPLLQAAVGPEFEVSTWHDVAAFVDDVIANQNFILRVIEALFLLVAMLGVGNTMLLSVYERTREIGTMMSLGVCRRHILQLFLVEAGLIALAGGTAGATIGVLSVAYAGAHGVVLHFPSIPRPVYIYPTVRAGYVFGVLSLCTFGAVTAAIFPALRGSRQRPVEALAAV